MIKSFWHTSCIYIENKKLPHTNLVQKINHYFKGTVLIMLEQFSHIPK